MQNKVLTLRLHIRNIHCYWETINFEYMHLGGVSLKEIIVNYERERKRGASLTLIALFLLKSAVETVGTK